ncbi:hypothetical protein SAMN06265795_101418 [Noviherbaspirillum humi]|uniref:STAS domain-containing protein n=1 Tax=Noviherbaspirillum humi TaxID=1688639 RepID=A0A239CGV5_9BURK|nr:hypothetical protein [Noviherbaspirillum humi]SNS18573.1 hypothetical protein SAMN06265795_101418 [Noviherbaspirillum humi]
MSIFSFFGKKPRRTDSDDDTGRAERTVPAPTADASASRDAAGSASPRNAQAARNTARKIDAIESEMTSVLSGMRHKLPASAPASAPAKNAAPAQPANLSPGLSRLGTTTGMLLDGTTTLMTDFPVPEADPEAALAEAAILYASGQPQAAELLLLEATRDTHAESTLTPAWWMLFDLYQLTGRQSDFETLGLAYASRFETSPPGWQAATDEAPQAAQSTAATLPFSGRLDAGCIKTIERLKALSASTPSLRLDFMRVSGADADGCALLLAALRQLHKRGMEPYLIGASRLVQVLRDAIAAAGPREMEPGWLLLLEVLRLLNQEQAFEETSMDYCLAFEVSPPPFVAPAVQPIASLIDLPDPESEADRFRMPAVIEGRTEDLVRALLAHAGSAPVSTIDCSRLARVEFNASAQLALGLAPHCAGGKVIELREVNHLVARLFATTGLADIVRVVPRKY